MLGQRSSSMHGVVQARAVVAAAAPEAVAEVEVAVAQAVWAMEVTLGRWTS